MLIYIRLFGCKIHKDGVSQQKQQTTFPFNHLRRVWRYQRGDQSLYMEEDNTMAKRKNTNGQTTIYKT